MGSSIINKIPNTNNLDKDLVKKWHSVKGVLMGQVNTEANVEPAVCLEFVFDLEGLLRQYLRVPEELIYPTMLVNNFNCSQSYDGRQNKFWLLSGTDAQMYASLFKRKIKTKKR